MQLLLTFAQGVGWLIVLAGALFCLCELIATMRAIARSEDHEERLVAASGIVWYGAAPLIFILLYALACLVIQYARPMAWWILPIAFVACAVPFVVAGLRGRRELQNAYVPLRRHAVWNDGSGSDRKLSGG